MRRAVAVSVVLAITGTTAFGYWSAGSEAGGNGASASTGLNGGSTPAVSVIRTTATLTWSATTLTTGGAVSGYRINRYDTATTPALQSIVAGSSCSGTVAALTCTETNVPDGMWTYTVTPRIGTNWVGNESPRSVAVRTDSTAPVNAITLSSVTGGAYKTGNTVYYRGSSDGSFLLSNAVADAGSGPQSSATAVLANNAVAPVFTHSPTTVSSPADGPFVSARFTWTSGAAGSPSVAVTANDKAGNTARTTLTFLNDSTAPTARAMSYPNGPQNGRSITVTLTGTDSDAGSGIASRRLERSFAPYSGGSCGTPRAFVPIGPDNPAATYSDTGVQGGACYRYRYLVTDNLGLQTIVTNGTSAAIIDYAATVVKDGNLVNFWRLGETRLLEDGFSGPAGEELSRHPVDGTFIWSKFTASTVSGVLTNGERLRRSANGAAGGASYQTTNALSDPNYVVEAAVVVNTVIAGDAVGVIGRAFRASTGVVTHYLALYDTTAAAWGLFKDVDGARTRLGVASAQTLAAGQSYTLALDMNGSTIRLLVDGAERVMATDTTLTTGGFAGVRLGDTNSLAGRGDTSNRTGLHLDNFRVTPRLGDSKGTNHGLYLNGPQLGGIGAIASDSSSAAQFDGLDDFGTVARQISNDFTIEFWFKSLQGSGNGDQFWQNAGLIDAEVGGAVDDFGISLRADGRVVAGVGNRIAGSDVSIVSPISSKFNDNVWHHVVFTRTMASGALKLYVDSADVGSATGGTQPLTSPSTIDFGRSRAGTNYFAGMLDEISFYNIALTAKATSDHYQLGLADAADTAGPTGGSIDALGLVGTGSQYSQSTTLNIGFTPGTDPSGVASTGAQVWRAFASLVSTGGANGVCGLFGTNAVIAEGSDPVSPKADVVADGTCYRYEYRVMDTWGNATTYTSAPVKVDTTAASAPELAISAPTNAFWDRAAATVYYRSAAPGSFTMTATATDPASGILNYTMPAFGMGWTAAPTANGVVTYSWNGAPSAPGTRIVTATNNAGLSSDSQIFTVTSDDTAPTNGTIDYRDGATAGTSVSVNFTTGTDSAAGVGQRLLQRSSAVLTGSACGAFSNFTTVANGTNPSSPFVDTVTAGLCYRYQYVVSDNVGNAVTSSSSKMVRASTYAATVSSTPSLVNFWRLGERRVSMDEFTGPAGVELNTRNGDVNAAWRRVTTSAITGVLTGDGRLRRALNATTGGASYSSSGISITANYAVEASVHVRSVVPGDAIGVQGRVDLASTGSGTYYLALYDTTTAAWELFKNVSGVRTSLGTRFSQPLTAGSTHALVLEMRGSTIRLLVDGVERVAVTDTAITAAGSAAVRLGDNGTTADITNTTGLQLDNFRVTPLLSDSKGIIDGLFLNGPLIGLRGAIGADDNTGAQFDGVDDFATVPRQIADDFTIEFWFKSSLGGGGGTGAQFWENAGLVDAEVNGTASDFGITLRDDGRVVAGVGDTSIVSTADRYDNNVWHHVVFTRIRASGALKLYVDALDAGSAVGGTQSLTGPDTINFGRSRAGTNYYAGMLDEVSTYNTALTLGEIVARYDAIQ